MADADTPPASPPPPFSAEGGGVDDEPAAPPPAAGVVMPLTKEAIEKYLSCQLDTHLNDATPRQKERERHEAEEQWKQPPTLQHHPSGGRSQHTKEPEAEQAANVPGIVEEGNDEQTKAKLEEQRVSLLQRRLADSEKQTKMLINRLAERNNGTGGVLPPKGAIGPGPSPHAPGAGHAHISLRGGRGDRMKKNQLEQALLDSASRAKQRIGKDNQSQTGRDHSPDSERQGVSREVSRALNARSERAGGSRSHKGRASLTGSESQEGSIDGDLSYADGYSKSAALDSVERGPSAESDLISAVGKKGRDKKGRQKSEKDLPSVDENRNAVGRTASGTEIDLETGLPKEQTKSSFSWFYAISFVVLIIALVYASIIILNRYT